MKDFFSVQEFFSPGISSQEFCFPQNQTAGKLYLKSPIPPAPPPPLLKPQIPQLRPLTQKKHNSFLARREVY